MRHLSANINQVLLLLIKCAVMSLCIYFIYQKLSEISFRDFFVSFIYENGLMAIELLVIFLLTFSFFNWCAEAAKWKRMMSKTIPMTFRQSLKAVLAGLALGFITPARAGDAVGRWINVSHEKKSSALAVFFYSSVFQTMITLLTGCTALFLLMMSFETGLAEYGNAEIYLVIFSAISILLVFYAVFSENFQTKISRINFFKNRKWTEKINYSTAEKINFLLISLLRYSFFCIQFVIVLYMLNVSDDIYFLTLNVAAIYLISFFLPSVIAGKLGVREAVAVVVLGGNPQIDLQIVIASLIIWFFNLALPALVGSVIIYRHPAPASLTKTSA